MFNVDELAIGFWQQGQVNDLRLLFHSAFGKRPSSEYFLSKYFMHNSEINTYCTIAYYREKPVAFYGAVPQKFKNGDNFFWAAHAGDSITIPDFQRKGIHKKLANLSYEKMIRDGLHFVYAFHSENTMRATKPLGWQNGYQMHFLEVPISTLPIQSVLERLNMASILRNQVVSYEIEGHSYQNPVLNDRHFGVEYDDHYLNRIDESNKMMIDVEGCQFFLKWDSILRVGYFKASSDEQLKNAMKKLKGICAKSGVRKILFQVSKGTQQYQQLSSIGVLKPSWMMGYKLFEPSLNMSAMKNNYADLDTF